MLFYGQFVNPCLGRGGARRSIAGAHAGNRWVSGYAALNETMGCETVPNLSASDSLGAQRRPQPKVLANVYTGQRGVGGPGIYVEDLDEEPEQDQAGIRG